MTEVILLDVGHGNCTIVHSDAVTMVIDCPTGALLLDTLDDLGVERVETAIISHADKDHIAGIISLLTSNPVRVERVFVNPDGQKNTKTWRDFRVAVAEAELRGTVEVVTSLSTTTPGIVAVGDAEIAVLSPSAALALTGVGGKTTNGNKTVTANTLSGVLRIKSGNAGAMLLAADMDEISLDEAIGAEVDLAADILVFPHHGGLPGNTDPEDFANRLLAAVNPTSVIFSNGRGGHSNPRREIVQAVRNRRCAIACTQLSTQCQSTEVDATDYLETLRASGRARGACCAGSMTFGLTPELARAPGVAERHQEFISQKIASPMCR